METLGSAIGVLATIAADLVYSFSVISKLPKGFPRILALLPVLGTYILLPLRVSTVHMRGIIAFLFTWISSFKLMMLCFDVGPLAKPWRKQSALQFMAVAAFPIKVRDTDNSDKKPGFWLFFPPIIRSGTDVRAIAEYEVLWRWMFPAIG